MKVLVVEDDRKLARFLKRVLSEEGYASDVCASGKDAVALGCDGGYDLIILDWMIPDGDGLEVCRELRRRGCKVAILMLTARGETAELVMALDAGADDYLVKPFEIEELVARVRALLRRTGGPPTLDYGLMVIDQDQRRVQVGGAFIDLTAREFNLLFHLARHAGEVVTRGELMTELWSTDADPGSNVVDVSVSRLREKLGEASALIETVRGKGYCLRVPDWGEER